MSDQKTSLLINRQVPEFVREEHPNFISFLEAYYEFLENEQGSEKNDLVAQSKKLRYISDIDSSIETFENNFFNTFASLVPRTVSVDKAVLIKNLLPLYLAKGNEKSFKLLFRLLFDEEVEVIQPKTSVLKASDGKWLIEKAFRISQDVYSTYTGNGTNTTFKLAQVVDSSEIVIYVNGIIQTTGFTIRKESRKLIFNIAPTNGSLIRILYNNFNYELLNNRKITGTTSNAYAVVERTGQKTVNGVAAFELYVNTKTLVGQFTDGETGRLNIIDPDDFSLIELEVLGLSILKTINIINGGSSYNVGDPVIITGGNATKEAQAFVSEVFLGYINKIRVLSGGSGFKTGSNVNLIGTTANASLVLAIDGVDTSGTLAANSFIVNTDKIGDYTSKTISDANYGFPSAVTDNVNTKIIDALTLSPLTGIGPITNVAILFANATFSSIPTLDAESAPYNAGGSTEHVLSTGSLGRLTINSGGDNYSIGDELVFALNYPMTFGFGAAAAVTNVSTTGAITKVQLQPPRISGTVNVNSTLNTLVGTGTVFQRELQVGDQIMVNNQISWVNVITSNTSLTTNVNFHYTETNRKIGKFEWLPIGGINYEANKLPTITVSSLAGANANISVQGLLGDGENLLAASDKNPGEILKIRIIDAGQGYEYPPEIDLSGSGDGTATANATVESTYVTFPGRWTTSDSILSASERVIQGRNFYIDYAYVLSSKVEFDKFKDVFKTLIHPAGFVEYAEYKIDEVVATNNVSRSNITTSNSVAGTVNTNGSMYLVGTGTLFNIANNHIITIGSQIAVNSEIRTVNAIYSNTVLTVSSPFTYSANVQDLIILA
jgi:hypothetical protein